MPRAPRKCPKKDCPNLITSTAYCPDHTTHGWINGGRPRTTTTAHRAWAAQVLDRDNHLCRIQRPGCTWVGTTADHVTPIAEGGAEFDLANGQAACKPCHAKKSSEEGNRARRRARVRRA